jgi:hypothetical protein
MPAPARAAQPATAAAPVVPAPAAADDCAFEPLFSERVPADELPVLATPGEFTVGELQECIDALEVNRELEVEALMQYYAGLTARLKEEMRRRTAGGH